MLTTEEIARQRACKHCGSELVRRANEALTRFRKRQFCCTTCAYHYKSGLVYGQHKQCKQCNEELTRREGESPAAFERRTFCDRTCANRYKNDQIRGKANPNLQGEKNGMWGKKHTDEARAMQRQAALDHPPTKEQQAKATASRIGKKKSAAVRQRMSDAAYLRWLNHPEQRETYRERFLQTPLPQGRFRRTSIEVATAAELDKLGIVYEWNAPLLGKWCVDFLIASHNLVIECDGTYWHSLPEIVQKDQEKNKAILDAGYKLLRLPERDICKHLDTCIERIKQALSE